jgi:hypothetical protein
MELEVHVIVQTPAMVSLFGNPAVGLAFDYAVGRLAAGLTASESHDKIAAVDRGALWAGQSGFGALGG